MNLEDDELRMPFERWHLNFGDTLLCLSDAASKTLSFCLERTTGMGKKSNKLMIHQLQARFGSTIRSYQRHGVACIQILNFRAIPLKSSESILLSGADSIL